MNAVLKKKEEIHVTNEKMTLGVARIESTAP